MSVSLSKGLVDVRQAEDVHEGTLRTRRMAKGGRRLSWTDRECLRDNSMEGLYDVLRAVAFRKRYYHDYDFDRGSWGTWGVREGFFVGHTSTETGARVQARRMNQDDSL